MVRYASPQSLLGPRVMLLLGLICTLISSLSFLLVLFALLAHVWCVRTGGGVVCVVRSLPLWCDRSIAGLAACSVCLFGSSLCRSVCPSGLVPSFIWPLIALCCRSALIPLSLFPSLSLAPCCAAADWPWAPRGFSYELTQLT